MDDQTAAWATGLERRILAGRYRLSGLLGVGGMGAVFRAEHIDLGRQVAVKLLLPARIVDSHAFTRFRLEARTAARVAGDGVVPVLDFDRDADLGPFQVMELLRGESLHDRLRRGPLDSAHATQVLRDVLATLGRVHAAGVVHRDLKPANLFLEERPGGAPRVRVLDFGIARVRDPALAHVEITRPGAALGTPGYAAPEQIANAATVDARADLFAVGLLLYATLVGRGPFADERPTEAYAALRAGRVPSLRAARTGLPPEFYLAYEWATALDPAARPSDAAALAAALPALPPPTASNLAPPQATSDAPPGDADEESGGHRARARSSSASSARGTSSPRQAPGTPGARPRAARTPRSTPGRPSNNLTPDGGGFVGRVQDLAAVGAAFDAGATVVTVVGPAGVGKTRLAREFGRRASSLAYEGGVWFCDLTDARLAADVAASVARALGLEPDAAALPARGESRLGRALRHRGRVLLILDNAEQAASQAAEAVARWCGEAPNVRFIVTSRVALGLAGEVRHEVAPLEPDDGAALFTLRAMAARAGWTPSVTDRGAIATIVLRLDGLPLAIELAAARAGVLAPVDLLARLRLGSADVLHNPRHDAPARHATLHAAIDWSWRLLDRAEQAALAQCSVFHGGFTLEAAEAVLRLPLPARARSRRATRGKARTTSRSVLDAVQSLRDKSLLRVIEPAETPGVLRFGLYETIRTFATERLSARERERAAARHAAYYLARGRALLARPAWEPRWRVDALETENLAVVHARTLDGAPFDRARATAALDAALAYDRLLTLRGPLERRVPTLTAALDAVPSETAPPALRARALATRADAHRRSGGIEAARRDAEAALTLAQGVGAGEVAADAIGVQAACWLVAGRYDLARECSRAQIAAASTAGAVSPQSQAHYIIGWVETLEGRLREAREAFQRAIVLAESLGDVRRALLSRSAKAVVDHEAGLLDDARAGFERAIAESETLGEHGVLAEQLVYLGDVELEEGRASDAAALCERAIRHYRAAGMRLGEAQALFHLGMCRDDEGRTGDARAAYEAALEVFVAVSALPWVVVVQSLLGRRDADDGRLDAARARFAAADERRRELGELTCLEASRIYRGHLDLALVRAAGSTGERASANREAVRELVAWATTTPAGGGDGGVAPAARSYFVRLALRTLERAALRDDATAEVTA